MEDFEQKTDSMEEEKTTSSEISCAEEATENCIEMTESYDEEHAQEATVYSKISFCLSSGRNRNPKIGRREA